MWQRFSKESWWVTQWWSKIMTCLPDCGFMKLVAFSKTDFVARKINKFLENWHVILSIANSRCVGENLKNISVLAKTSSFQSSCVLTKKKYIMNLWRQEANFCKCWKRSWLTITLGRLKSWISYSLRTQWCTYAVLCVFWCNRAEMQCLLEFRDRENRVWPNWLHQFLTRPVSKLNCPKISNLKTLEIP